MGHYLSAVAIMYASTGDVRFKQRGDLLVAELAKVQAAESAKFHPGYLSAFPEEFFDRLDARTQVWAPWYTIHKIMAGLLDMYQQAHNEQALDVLKKQAGWVRFRVDRLTEAQQQADLRTEFGGMAEVLANLYGVTGDAEWLRVSKKFDDKLMFDPLAEGNDPLVDANGRGVHGNTQIPKMIASARAIRAHRRSALQGHRLQLLAHRRREALVRDRRQHATARASFRSTTSTSTSASRARRRATRTTC